MPFLFEPASWGRTHVTELPWTWPKEPTFSDWEPEFVFLRKINGNWVFCKTIYKRRRLGYEFFMCEYALNDFELIQKEAK